VKTWEPVTEEEIEGRVPLKYLRIDGKNHIIVEPAHVNLKFWEGLFKGLEDKAKFFYVGHKDTTPPMRRKRRVGQEPLRSSRHK
jgi:hypothetical protein